jgi:hypothetical protein
MHDPLIATGVVALLAIIVWLDHERAAALHRAHHAEVELAAAERDLRRTHNGRTRHTRVARPAVARAKAPTPLELARVVCPLYTVPGCEDRWMVRRRIHERAAA